MKKNTYKTKMYKVFKKYQEVPEMYATKHMPLNLTIPPNFRMLCALLDVKPTQVINDFMAIVSSSYQVNFPIEANKAAVEYLLKCEYGKRYFYKEDIAVMLSELEAVRVVTETMDKSNSTEMNLFFCFKHMQAQTWFKTWYTKNKRKKTISVLNEY
ncbi:hypothetical protein [Pedobacter caeni]|uniref:Uncharacterized protein n=1 Tax=Pedobacter caeni TaxID=288992 RepID=A0A1M4T826_9SPHI|nr:hypothetical protein [Pedobacter caeni]SHE40646.1 hypothetical protein SAMN04488522_101114 [Pedobacter caeni]